MNKFVPHIRLELCAMHAQQRQRNRKRRRGRHACWACRLQACGCIMKRGDHTHAALRHMHMPQDRRAGRLCVHSHAVWQVTAILMQMKSWICNASCVWVLFGDAVRPLHVAHEIPAVLLLQRLHCYTKATQGLDTMLKIPSSPAVTAFFFF